MKREPSVPDNHTINSLPLWAKFIAYLGFPIAVATLLLWVVVKQLEHHNQELIEHNRGVELHVLKSAEHALEVRLAMHQLTYILQVMCQNSAKNKEQAALCLEKPVGP